MLSSIEYGGASRAALDRDAVLAGVLDLLLAPHLPAAHRRDDLHLGSERGDGGLDPDLVVALAGAAVGDGVAAGLARGVDRELGDQRPAERGEERVAAAVERVRLDRRQHVVLGELLARVDHDAVERAQLDRLALHVVEVLAGLAEVDRERHHLGVVLVLDPLEHHARVEAAASRAAARGRPRRARPRTRRSSSGSCGRVPRPSARDPTRRVSRASASSISASLTVSGGSRRTVSGPVAFSTSRSSSSARRTRPGASSCANAAIRPAAARAAAGQRVEPAQQAVALRAHAVEEAAVLHHVQHRVARPRTAPGRRRTSSRGRRAGTRRRTRAR